jgi:DNA mismatch repair ATPase MutS
LPLAKRADAACKALTGFETGAFFVTSGGNVGTGLGDTILEYLKMFFHLDLIKFDSMVETFAGHEEECMDLLDVVGTIDAAMAAASFRQLLPRWCHGTINDVPVISGKEMYHPLLRDPVPNSFTCEGGNLITGSNASGKSTFLKNIAVNQILMQSLDTVPAEAWSAPYMKIVTSMALTDNLLGGESYFIVEIRSLKRIVDMAADSDVPVLGIVDEVLRGTNTVKRIAASSKILEMLAKGNAVIFAATHDIELSYILESLYRNLHFEEEIDGGDVRFCYRLMEGRAMTSNAIRLLSVMGYNTNVVDSARKMAEDFTKSGEWDRI